MSFDWEKIVQKATSSKNEPPKRKHVRNLILETWKINGGSDFLHELFKRPLEVNDVVFWKALITLHTVLNEGHPKVVEDCYYQQSFLEQLKASWQRGTGGNPNVTTNTKALIVSYCNFILSKLTFHKQYPEFPSDFSKEKYLKGRVVTDVARCLQIVTHMLELHQSIFLIQSRLFESKDLSDIKACCLIPLVMESYNLYSMETYLIYKLVDEVETMEVLSFVIEQYYSQYMTQRTFYSETSMIKSVSSVIAVPMLPKDPPVFARSKKNVIKPPNRKLDEKQQTIPTSVPASLSMTALSSRNTAAPIQPATTQSQPNELSGAFLSKPIPSVSISGSTNPFNPFAPSLQKGDSWVTFSSDPQLPLEQSSHLMMSSTGTPFSLQPIAISETKPAPSQQAIQISEDKPKLLSSHADFSELVNMVRVMKPSTESLERKRKDEELQRQRKEEERRRKEEEERIKREADKKRSEELERKRKEEQLRQQEETRKRQEEQKIREEAKRQAAEEENKKREEMHLRQIRAIAQEETTREIKDLKLRIVELESALEKERIRNSQLEKENSEMQQTIQSLRGTLENEEQRAQSITKANEKKQEELNVLSERYQRVQQECEALKMRLDAEIRQHQAEYQSLLDKEIESAHDLLEKYLSRLDNPTNLGNDEATAEMVVDDTEKMLNVVVHTMTVIGSDMKMDKRQTTLQSLKSIRELAVSMLDDSKGYSRKIDDVDIRQHLLEAARGTASALDRLLLLGVGCVEDTNDRRQQLEEGLQTLKGQANELINVSKEAQSRQQNTASKRSEEEGIVENEELEMLAERELLSAAKVIEQAANSLLATKQKQVNDTNKMPEVTEAILEAVMAITKATAMLVASAASAQKERKEEGIKRPTLYKKDPRWSQGLISAARAVANASQTLISTANDAVQGKIEDESLVAASKAVTSSTAQLVAACRTKAADPNSSAQIALAKASRAVSLATTQLIEAVRAVASKLQMSSLETNDSAGGIQQKIKEMELQTQILRLEKELNQARNRLFDLRKQEYAPLS